MLNNSINSLQKRLLAVFVLVTFIFVAIIFRLLYLQVFKSSWLRERAAEQWYRDLPLSASRGKILDANGNALALSRVTYDVYVKPNSVTDDVGVALQLASVLNLNYDNVLQKVHNTKMSEVVIKRQVESETALGLVKKGLDGVVVSENSKRYYPYGDLLTQVIGFTTNDNVGQTGLEAHFEKYLQGLKGFALQESDARGVKIDNTLSTYIPSVSGLDITLTIDAYIQVFLEKALSQLMLEQKPKTATGIVLEADTGRIVAMSTKPSFDLNNVPRDNVATLLECSRNIAITDIYEPGSTFKVLTMATAIEEGVAKLSDHFFDPGYRMVDGEKIKCWRLTGHGSQTLTEGLCNSCNAVFVDLALRLGRERLYDSFENWGLGAKLGVDFMGEAGGLLMNESAAKTVDIARMGFGQAVAVSPIQLISAFASVVNGGNLMRPYFVEKITDGDGNTVVQSSPSVIKRTISEETSAVMREMVEAVVKQYSGFNAFIPGHRVSGKTGTTQKYKDGKIAGTYIASFVGAYPADKPDYVILIVADEPGGDSYYGSVVATPYAKMVIEDIIDYKKYPSSDMEEDLKKLEKTIPMPSIIGLDVYEATSLLSSLGLQYEIQGEGNMVVGQLPSEGTMLYPNAIVVFTVA